MSNEHHLKEVATIDLPKAAVPIDPVKLALSVPVAATTGPVVKVGLVIWIGRLRTGRVAISPASVSKTFNAAVVVADSVVIVLVVEDSVGVIALVAADLAEAALADLAAAAGAGADGNN